MDRINGEDRVLIPVYMLTQNDLNGDPGWRIFHYVWKENPVHNDVEAILGIAPVEDEYIVEVGKLTNRAIKITIDGNRSGTIPAEPEINRGNVYSSQVGSGHVVFQIRR
jgi:hypothetical protein